MEQSGETGGLNASLLINHCSALVFQSTLLQLAVFYIQSEIAVPVEFSCEASLVVASVKLHRSYGRFK